LPRPDVARVFLIGFMAAGKTTVGRLLADRLGWRFVDVDEEIVRRSGETVPEIFRLHGEAVFRALEARLTAELRSLDRAVIAPGGGWVTTPSALDDLPDGTVVVWLRVSAEEAIRRVGPAADRPLLAGADPLARARSLIAERESLYRRADLTIDVDGRSPAAIAAEIAARLATRTNE
jgi:shikimate kinase